MTFLHSDHSISVSSRKQSAKPSFFFLLLPLFLLACLFHSRIVVTWIQHHLHAILCHLAFISKHCVRSMILLHPYHPILPLLHLHPLHFLHYLQCFLHHHQHLLQWNKITLLLLSFLPIKNSLVIKKLLLPQSLVESNLSMLMHVWHPIFALLILVSLGKDTTCRRSDPFFYPGTQMTTMIKIMD